MNIIIEDERVVLFSNPVRVYPIKSVRKACCNEEYLRSELEFGKVYRMSGHLVATLCYDDTIDIYEF